MTMSASVLFDTTFGTVFAPDNDGLPLLQVKYVYFEEKETDEYWLDEWELLAPLAERGFANKLIKVKFRDCTMRAVLVEDVSSDCPGYGYWLDYTSIE
jgi:hypothetical protein